MQAPDAADTLPVPLRVRAMMVMFWIGTIWLAGWLGVIATGVISSSNPLRGAWIGAMNGIVLSPLMLVVTLPLGLLGWGIASWRPLRRWWLGIALVLPMLLSFSGVIVALQERLTPPAPPSPARSAGGRRRAR